MKVRELAHRLAAPHADPHNDVVVWNWTYDDRATDPQPAWHLQSVVGVAARNGHIELDLGPLDRVSSEHDPYGELPQLLRDAREELGYHAEEDKAYALLDRIDAELAARGWAAPAPVSD